MMDHYALITLVINSLFCLGLHFAVQPGFALDWISRKTEKWPEWVTNPLYGCPTCMASLHSIIPFWYYLAPPGRMDFWVMIEYMLYVLALAGLNTILYRNTPE